MISIEFSGDSKDALFKHEVNQILELIKTCSSHFKLPESLDIKLKVNSSTTNGLGLIVDFTLYVFSVNNQNSVFSVFELVFSSSENGIRYLLYSHHKQHSLEKIDELENLILEIFDNYDYTGIEESILTQNQIQPSIKSVNETAKKGNKNRYGSIERYLIETVANSMHPPTATVKKGTKNRCWGIEKYPTETVSACIRIPEYMPYKVITQESFIPWKAVGGRGGLAKRETVKKHNITDFKLNDYNMLGSQSISKGIYYPRLGIDVYTQGLKPYEAIVDVNYNEITVEEKNEHMKRFW
ncbi:TPA: hypothetical protein ROX87_004793 [Bacillus thuringiensis]|uniref:hypothetical protein n=1 Tax=Bacillus thuringiensis TaxID=1428 RepID=UPI000BF27CE9|nr:hypothetical protein [Bacillus thuringiensis]PER40844.1 hypothetical protein CN472_28830 [Bacillus thuringiensis]HDX9535323.1 hypothetical protein [Bacillus thuringiensis]